VQKFLSKKKYRVDESSGLWVLWLLIRFATEN
jgi:hypothetical protein